MADFKLKNPEKFLTKRKLISEHETQNITSESSSDKALKLRKKKNKGKESSYESSEDSD